MPLHDRGADFTGHRPACRRKTPLARAVLAAVFLAVPTLGGLSGGAAAFASGAPAGGIAGIVGKLTESSKASFSATYHVVSEQFHTQTIIFAHDPTKQAILTSAGHFYVNPANVTECTYESARLRCETLPRQLPSIMSNFRRLFGPGNVANTLRNIEKIVDAHGPGVKATTSSATYAGFATTCVTIKGSKRSMFPTPVKPVIYCAANSSGVLDHVRAYGSTLTLTRYKANPPASTFKVPSGSR